MVDSDKNCLAFIKRLFDSVISKCCSEEGSRTGLYEIYDSDGNALAA
jgi:hypothetical protein